MQVHTMSVLFPTVLVLLWLGQLVYGSEFVPEIFPSLNSSSCGDTTPLYFGLIMSFDGQQLDSSGSVPGVKVALDRINSDCSILPGYSLHYTLADSKCTRTVALDALFEATLLSGPTKLAVIGSGCSLATEPTAEVSHYYNITQLSCVSSSPSLGDRSRFQRYFQLEPSEDSLALAYYGVIIEYKWSHVSLIVQNENLFTETVKRLKRLLDKVDVTYDERLFTTENGVASLGKQPFNVDRRIHLIASYEGHALQLLCEAYRSKIFLPRHVFLTPAWYNREWWRMDYKEYNFTCTADEREVVLNGSLAFLHLNYLNRSSQQVITTDGLTGEDYLESEKKYLNMTPHFFSAYEAAPYCYDAAWTLAYALNNTLKDIQNSTVNMRLRNAYGLDGNDSQFGLEDFSYRSSALLDVIFAQLEDTEFNGLTGGIEFDRNGILSKNQLRIYQFRASVTGRIEWVQIGTVVGAHKNDSTFTFQYLDGENVSTVWPDGVPYDGVPNNITVSVDTAVTAVYAILNTAGIIFAGGCIIFNFVFRNKKLIKLASPNLNYIIGAGAIILYCGLYFFIIPTIDQTAMSVLCNLTTWLSAIGYSLCYGTIVAKMTRVYYIFQNPSSKKKTAIKDWMLALGVMCLVAIDVIILLVYTLGTTTSSDGLNGLAAQKIFSSEMPQSISEEFGVITNNFIFMCSSESRDIFLGVLYGYKSLLQIIAIIFTFSIRKVKVRGLDDAKYIAASIYITSLVFSVIIVSTYTLKNYVNILPIVFCTGYLIGTTMILCLVFIPLMVGLYKDPEGETIFNKSNKTISSNTDNLQTHTIEGLKKRIIELEVIALGSQQKESWDSKSIIPTEAKMEPIVENTFNEGFGLPNDRPEESTIWDNEV